MVFSFAMEAVVVCGSCSLRQSHCSRIIAVTVPAARKCVAMACVKRWRLLCSPDSPGCSLHVPIILSACGSESLSGSCKKILKINSPQDLVWSVNQALSHYREGKYANFRRITEAFPGKVDPTARNHCLWQWGFGEVKSGCSASDT